MSVVSDAGKQLANLQQQISMTNYADVDEKSSNGAGSIPSIISNFPMNMKAHPFLEKQTNKKKLKNEGKLVRPLLDIRNSRLDEINKGEFNHGGGKLLAGHDPSRTL